LAISTIGALEAHELSKNPPSDQLGIDGDASAAAVKAKRFVSFNCGERGHHSSRCSKPPKKNKSNAQANLVVARAGATTAVPLGCYVSDDNDDEEIDVVWG
jgi:hypothetical protein